MPIEYDPTFATFDPKDCGRPMVEAVEALADAMGRPFDSFVGQSVADVSALASETYGQDLPEFWRVWQEWHAPQPRPEMGDL